MKNLCDVKENQSLRIKYAGLFSQMPQVLMEQLRYKWSQYSVSIVY